MIYDAVNLLRFTAKRVNAAEYYISNTPRILRCKAAGAPAAARVPDNWDDKTMGTWTGAPRSMDQIYVDQTSKKIYVPWQISGSTNDWVVLN